MSEQEIPVYVPGEWIRLQLTFTHKMKITTVGAIFVYHGREETNTPSIVMQPEAGVRSWTTEREGEQRRTVIDLVSIEPVPTNVYPGGEYRLAEVRMHSYLGEVHRLEGIPDIRCRIHPGEPDESPTFEDVYWYP